MLRLIVESLKESKDYLFKDRVIFILSLIPVLIGIILYSSLGLWAYSLATTWFQSFIGEHLSTGFLATVLYYLVSLIMTVLLFFAVNWTFILLVSLIASPFNDFISERIEKKMTGKEVADWGKSLSRIFRTLLSVLMNECKKVLFILFFSLAALLMGYFPILSPFSILLTALLLAVEFLDYNWSRHRLSFRECASNLKKHSGIYLLSGLLFFVLISIPILNLLFLPLAVVYFSVLWSKLQKVSS